MTQRNIVDLLMDQETSLSSAMLQFQVALARIGEEEGRIWVHKELEGYGPGETAPEYRRTEGRVTGWFVIGPQIVEHPIPLASVIGRDKAAPWTTPFLREGVHGLEALGKGTSGDAMTIMAGEQLLNEYGPQLNSHMKAPTLDGPIPVWCTRVRVQISPTAPAYVLGRIRQTALDLALALEKIDPRIVANNSHESREATTEKGWPAQAEEVRKIIKRILEGVAVSALAGAATSIL